MVPSKLIAYCHDLWVEGGSASPGTSMYQPSQGKNRGRFTVDWVGVVD